MVGDLVDRAHRMHLFGGVGAAQEEDLAGEFLAGLSRQVGAAEAAVERTDIGVGLLEPGVLAAGEGQVAHHVQRVPATGCPAVDQADDGLGHEPDQSLHLEDVQPTGPRRVHRLGGVAGGVLVAAAAADALIAAGAERPAGRARRLALARGRAVAGEQDDPDVGGAPGVVEDAVELVDGVRPERVAHLRPVEGDAHRRLADVAVVGDVGQVLEAGNRLPEAGVERIARGVGHGVTRYRSGTPSSGRPALRTRRGWGPSPDPRSS